MTPRASIAVETPKIVHFLVVVFLTAKQVNFLTVLSNTHGSTSTGTLVRADGLSVEAVTFVLAVNHLIDTASIDVTAETHKAAITHITNSVVIPAQSFNLRLQSIRI